MTTTRDDSPACIVCGSTEDVKWEPNPYLLELYDDDCEDWYCEKCLQELADEV